MTPDHHAARTRSPLNAALETIRDLTPADTRMLGRIRSFCPMWRQVGALPPAERALATQYAFERGLDPRPSPLPDAATLLAALEARAAEVDAGCRTRRLCDYNERVLAQYLGSMRESIEHLAQLPPWVASEMSVTGWVAHSRPRKQSGAPVTQLYCHWPHLFPTDPFDYSRPPRVVLTRESLSERVMSRRWPCGYYGEISIHGPCVAQVPPRHPRQATKPVVCALADVLRPLHGYEPPVSNPCDNAPRRLRWPAASRWCVWDPWYVFYE